MDNKKLTKKQSYTFKKDEIYICTYRKGKILKVKYKGICELTSTKGHKKTKTKKHEFYNLEQKEKGGPLFIRAKDGSWRCKRFEKNGK